MTGVVPGLALPVRSGRAAIDQAPKGRSRLPVPELRSCQRASTVYGVAVMDCNGRVAELALLRAMSWRLDVALDARVTSALIVLRPDPRGLLRLRPPGYFRLPAEIRHRCGLVPGSRVLLAGHPYQGVLVIYPPAELDRMVSAFHAAALGSAVAS